MVNKLLIQEQNILLAKRKMVEYIYRSSVLEGINVTFHETQAIFDGKSVEGISIDDIKKINNLKKAWMFLLETLDRITDFDYLSRLNMIIGSEGSIYGAGKVRAYDVRISGTKWVPKIPFEYEIRNEMADILEITSTTERAITLMLWCMRRQIFIDGNKRTAMMIANKEMITNGAGIISIPDEKIEDFYKLLISFYESNDMNEIKEFVYEHCIDGITDTNMQIDNIE